MTERVDRRILDHCIEFAKASPDPSTKVGSIITDKDGAVLAWGYNCFPPGIEATPERLNDREKKMRLIVHAEINAVAMAAREGEWTIGGGRLYVAATDASGTVWGGPPCVRCTVEAIAAGITEFVSFPMKNAPSRWTADLIEAKMLIEEVGLVYREVERNPSHEH